MKKFINKILDVPKLIRTIWIMLWVILIILLVFKFCFNLWYPIIVKNEVFINICNYIDEHKWLIVTIMFILYFLSVNIISLTCMGKRKYPSVKFGILINIIIISLFIIKYFVSVLGSILEIFYIIGFFIFINIKNKNFPNKKYDILMPIIQYAIINLWQLLIYLVRGLDISSLNNYPVLIPYIIQIDYYIFLIITWIGVSYMGLYSIGWLFGKDITVLKAEREKELSKAKPNMKKINSIDIRIAELEKEGK